jgi:hypothetical protein
MHTCQVVNSQQQHLPATTDHGQHLKTGHPIYMPRVEHRDPSLHTRNPTVGPSTAQSAVLSQLSDRVNSQPPNIPTPQTTHGLSNAGANSFQLHSVSKELQHSCCTVHSCRQREHSCRQSKHKHNMPFIPEPRSGLPETAVIVPETAVIVPETAVIVLR